MMEQYFRSNILRGLNLPTLLPEKRCNDGTVLQIQIHQSSELTNTIARKAL